MQGSLTIIIFGITSNLAQIKLIPALFDIFEKKLLPEGTKIIGVARSPKSKEELKEYLAETLAKKGRDTGGKTFADLTKSFHYVDGHVDDQLFYKRLRSYLSKSNFPKRKIFYLAVSPELYEPIFHNLKISHLNKQDQSFTRLMIEKPIGIDLKSAKKLNALLHEYFSEDQIYRLDHYLGKETIQNILAFRFGNELFEPLMNKGYIDHIQITAAEQFGVADRGGYYDTAGALKDVGQNHLLQILTAVCMEAPKQFSNESITKERVKILENLVASKDIVLGQYQDYLNEPNVKKDSQTESFFALKAKLNTPRFKGVPIYIRAGKMLQQNYTAVSVVFKVPVNRLFKNLKSGNQANVLTYRIQPNESITLKILTKKLGHSYELDPDVMQFSYDSPNQKKQLTDPYEKLLFDAIKGDQTFFNDAKEVEAAWKFIDRVKSTECRVQKYKPGSWGPIEADRLIQKDGRSWLEV